MQPKVSVCIPTYNRSKYLKEAIISVLNQTYCNFELIIVDNASTDDTEKVVNSFKVEDIRIRYFRNKKNLGPVYNLNKCLEYASGEYIKILCDDDKFSTDGALEEQVRIMEAYSDVLMCGCSINLINDNGDKIGTLKYMEKTGLVDSMTAVNECLRGANNRIGCPSTIMLRSSACKNIGKFNENFFYSCDWEYYVRILTLLSSKMYYLDKVLIDYRYHKTSESSLADKVRFSYENKIILMYILNYSSFKKLISFRRRLFCYLRFVLSRVKYARKSLNKYNFDWLLFFTRLILINFCFFDPFNEVQKFITLNKGGEQL